MKSTIATVGRILLLVAFISCSAVSLADMFGWLDKFPHLAGLKPDFAKLSVLAIGLIGSSLVLEHWFTLNDILEGVRRGDDRDAKLNQIHHTLAGVHELQFPTKVLTSRKEHYMSFLRAIESAPRNATIDVTHFEKLTATRFDTGENSSEALLMQEYRRKVSNGDLQVRQIVHVSTIHDLNEVEDRLQMFEGCLTYSLNIMYGFPIVPFLDLAIIHRHWAGVDLSNNPVEPYRSSTSIEFVNPSIVEELSKYFEIWWSRFSVPIKNRDGLHRDVLGRLRRILPRSDDRENTISYIEFAFATHCDPTIRTVLEGLTKRLSRLHVPAVLDAYRGDVTTVFANAVNQLDLSLQGRREVDRKAVEGILLDCFANAIALVNAVSYDRDQGGFWQSPFGHQLHEANKGAAGRGVKVTRVFILTDNQLTQRPILSLLKKQLEAGISVYYTTEREVGGPPADLCQDFLILDDEVLFRMEVTPGGPPVKDGFLSIQDRQIHEYNAIFRSLLLKAQVFRGDQTKL